jgi:CheY-like chemotaxis protein
MVLIGSTRILGNGIEAIEAFEYHSYDIVLMDIQMPEMDGLEATKIIRQRWHQNPRIIFVTSLTNCQDACLDAGADDFLTKPLGIETLRKAIEYHMPIPSFISSNSEEITATFAQ